MSVELAASLDKLADAVSSADVRLLDAMEQVRRTQEAPGLVLGALAKLLKVKADAKPPETRAGHGLPGFLWHAKEGNVCQAAHVAVRTLEPADAVQGERKVRAAVAAVLRSRADTIRAGLKAKAAPPKVAAPKPPAEPGK